MKRTLDAKDLDSKVFENAVVIGQEETKSRAESKRALSFSDNSNQNVSLCLFFQS
jgi:hypothetical protein